MFIIGVSTVETSIANACSTRNMSDVIVVCAELKVAGQTTEFVNKVLDKVKQGTASGGLDDL